MLFDFIRSGTPADRTDRHRLAGTTTVAGLPAKRLITVADRLTLVLLAATVSDPMTGNWEVSGLTEYPVQSLLITDSSIDDGGNARIFDFISQVTGV